MTTGIKSEASKSTIQVNGLDQFAIGNAGEVLVNHGADAGIAGQVLKSGGAGQPAVWGGQRVWKPSALVLGTEYAAPAWDIEINVSYVSTANTSGGTGYICTFTDGEAVTFTRSGGASLAVGVAAGNITIPANAKYTITAFGSPTSATFKELS